MYVVSFWTLVVVFLRHFGRGIGYSVFPKLVVIVLSYFGRGRRLYSVADFGGRSLTSLRTNV